MTRTEGGGDEREYEYGDENEGRNGSGRGAGTGDESGGQIDNGNLLSGIGDGSEYTRRRATPSSNQQP